MSKVQTINGIKSIDSVREKQCIQSKLQANSLFNFVGELEYILQPLESKMLSPRYCEENIKYLKIKRNRKIMNTIYYPMKCFCDINLHRIKEHLDCYGYYGLAFTKEWGMKNNIQPIQYVNPNSELRKSFAESFSMALKKINSPETNLEKNLKKNLLFQLMHLKPYEGKMQSRLGKKKIKKCFMDECEWRFIPDVSTTTYRQMYFDDNIINKGNPDDLNNSMINNPLISLKFEYADLKHIIVKTEEDLKILIEKIEKLESSPLERKILISKIIVWDVCGGDF